VKLALGILGLDKDVTIEKADPTDPADSIRVQNPIGKIPALIIEDGSVIYDSPVILEYLDHRAGGGKIIPKDADARFKALTLEAMCDGILDACILLVYEGRFRAPEKHEPKWIEHQQGKVKRAFAVLEAAPPVIGALPHVGHITLACVLGYGDLRFGGTWRNEYPRLVAWLDDFAARVPAFEKTRVTA
jgi:glutathione S-transferase